MTQVTGGPGSDGISVREGAGLGTHFSVGDARAVDILKILIMIVALAVAVVVLILLSMAISEWIAMVIAVVISFVILGISGLLFGPRNALLGTRKVTGVMDTIYFWLGYVCGIELLLLGFFITYQVVARKLDWVQAPGTDVMSGYVLAMAATWAFSYSLRSGAHVRIDVLLPYMGTKTRAFADWIAIFAVLFLGWVTMVKMWENVVNNYERGVVTNDYPLTPLFIPKIVVSLGFTLLCLTALQMMYSMVAEGFLVRWNQAVGGEEIEAITITGGEAAGAAD